jgi:hypothetical protein
MVFNFFKMNFFKATLTPELRAVVAQQDPEAMTVKKMYMVATSAQWEGKMKPPAAVNEISEEDIPVEAMDDKNDVAAFNRQGARPKTNQASYSRGGYTSGGGNYQSGSGSKEEETQAAEITQIGMTNSAISARFKGTDKKNAGNKSRRINPVVMPKDRLTGRGSTSWRNIQKRSRSTPLTTMTPYTRMMKTHSTLPEFSISQELQPFPAILGFSVKSWMTPLIQAPSVIPQLI